MKNIYPALFGYNNMPSFHKNRRQYKKAQKEADIALHKKRQVKCNVFYILPGISKRHIHKKDITTKQMYTSMPDVLQDLIYEYIPYRFITDVNLNTFDMDSPYDIFDIYNIYETNARALRNVHLNITYNKYEGWIYISFDALCHILNHQSYCYDCQCFNNIRRFKVTKLDKSYLKLALSNNY